MEVTQILYNDVSLNEYYYGIIRAKSPDYVAELIISAISPTAYAEIFTDAVYRLFNSVTANIPINKIWDQIVGYIITDEMDRFESILSEIVENCIDPTAVSQNNTTLYGYRQGLVAEDNIEKIYECIDSLPREYKENLLVQFPWLETEIWNYSQTCSVTTAIFDLYSSVIWSDVPEYYSVLLNRQAHLIFKFANYLLTIPDFVEYGPELDIDFIQSAPHDLNYVIIRCCVDYDGTPGGGYQTQLPLLTYQPGPPLPYA